MPPFRVDYVWSPLIRGLAGLPGSEFAWEAEVDDLQKVFLDGVLIRYSDGLEEWGKWRDSYPPTPAEARGSALGNRSLFPLFYWQSSVCTARKVSVEAHVWHMSGYFSIGYLVAFLPFTAMVFQAGESSLAFGRPGRYKLKHMSGTCHAGLLFGRCPFKASFQQKFLF